jgi:DNA-binding transcriptional MerR regulator
MLDVNLLSKVYYSIGEVSELLTIPQSQLRYWEAEFPQLKPGKNNRGERKYTKKEILIIEEIHRLVKERGFTIDGAKKELQKTKLENKNTQEAIKKLKAIKQALIDIKTQISTHP